MAPTLLLSLALVLQSPSQPSPEKDVFSDPQLVQLKAFATQPVDPSLSKTKQTAFKKKQNKAKLAYNARLKALQQEAHALKMAPVIEAQQRMARDQQIAQQSLRSEQRAEESLAIQRQAVRNTQLFRQQLLYGPATQTPNGPLIYGDSSAGPYSASVMVPKVAPSPSPMANQLPLYIPLFVP
ncbi:hypothetical protein [Singulisphaera sp. GP187]|uniref:hypothetical protein n=1 Tax=Singulisphaera sp. GP187 TaxID=1882752 RepID=UPI0009412676|nr:hypothetical protein [Singulisphaera sp. GP187]